jgi:hypothetical protein
MRLDAHIMGEPLEINNKEQKSNARTAPLAFLAEGLINWYRDVGPESARTSPKTFAENSRPVHVEGTGLNAPLRAAYSSTQSVSHACVVSEQEGFLTTRCYLAP